MGEIPASRMVEIMNERVSEGEQRVRVRCVERVEEIPVLQVQKGGDKVRIKHGVSSKTHDNIGPAFVEGNG